MARAVRVARASGREMLRVIPKHKGTDGDTRPACANLLDGLRPLVDAELGSRASALSRDFHEQGITFQISGREAPFPLDMLPRVVPAAEWRVVEAGVAPSAPDVGADSSLPIEVVTR